MSWRIVQSSTIGTSHTKTGAPCQDANAAKTIEQTAQGCVLACVVCDGAGSAPRSEEGAALACRTVLHSIERWWSIHPDSLPSDDDVKGWVFDASAAITEIAERDCVTPRDFACTLVAALVCPLGAVYLQVGDGGIVIEEQGAYRLVFWPEETEAVNLTYFITDESWWRHLQLTTSRDTPQAIALFSDGLQMLVLDFATRTAHAPFFKQIFSQVREWPAEQGPDLDRALAAYLSSDVVTSKTDDDKTLVLAVMP